MSLNFFSFHNVIFLFIVFKIIYIYITFQRLRRIIEYGELTPHKEPGIIKNHLTRFPYLLPLFIVIAIIESSLIFLFAKSPSMRR